MTDRDNLGDLTQEIDRRRGALWRLRKHWDGEPPAAFLSAKSREALQGRLRTLSINIPRLVVNSKVDRLAIAGLVNVDGEPAEQLWRDWQHADMSTESEMVHTDYYLYGSSYVLVWPGADGRPRPLAGNPFSMAADVDPSTGEVERAIRRWSFGGRTHAVVYTPDKAVRWTSKSPNMTTAAGGWEHSKTIDNPFGVVPVEPFMRRLSSDDLDGSSAVWDILDLTEALIKVLSDALVTSEHYARPRRWATGLEIEEDEDGNIIDPFGDSRFLQSESPDTEFGQFAAVQLDGYTDLTATITQQIGSLTGLPPHYLGLHGDQPASADGTRAAEAQLASAAYSDHRVLGRSWARVAQLMAAVRNAGVDPTARDYRAEWSSPEIRTPAQAADAAGKERDMGIPLETVLVKTLGYTPAEAQRVVEAADRDALVQAAGRLTPGVLDRVEP